MLLFPKLDKRLFEKNVLRAAADRLQQQQQQILPHCFWEVCPNQSITKEQEHFVNEIFPKQKISEDKYTRTGVFVV